MSRLTRLLILGFLTMFSSAGIEAQSVVSDGVKSFKAGDFKAAIQQLKNSDDPIELNFLGQSYEALSKKKDAAKAYERSLRSGYGLFEKGLTDWRTAKVNSSFLGILHDLGEILTVSISSAEKAVDLDSMSLDNEWRLKANVLYEMKRLGANCEELFRTDEVDSGLKVLTVPRAPLSDTPCDPNPFTGTVVTLLVVFHADGKTISVIPHSKWAKGCNASAMGVAKLIKFEPAVKNSKPVSVLKMMEYSFAKR